MNTYAVLSGYVVSNLIICDTLENAEAATHSPCVLITEGMEVSLGWIYDPATNTFSPPVDPPA